MTGGAGRLRMLGSRSPSGGSMEEVVARLLAVFLITGPIWATREHWQPRIKPTVAILLSTLLLTYLLWR
jgi:hypothetical protein